MITYIDDNPYSELDMFYQHTKRAINKKVGQVLKSIGLFSPIEFSLLRNIQTLRLNKKQ